MNCPVTEKDIMTAENIFGPDVGILKRKTVRQQASHVEDNMVDLTADIMNRHRNITLGGDIMFVNKIPFLMTISRDINFGTAVMLRNQQGKTILEAIRQLKQIYGKRGFNLSVILMDGQFESLRGDMAEMQLS